MTGRTLIANVAIFDGSGADRFPGEVLVEGDRIVAVERSAGGISAEDVWRIDASGETLMPGLIDGHAHITYPHAVDRRYPRMYAPIVDTTLMTVHNARLLLDHGFTSAYSAGAIKPGIEARLRDEIDAGRIEGPRLRAASMEIYFRGDPDTKPMAETPDEVRQFVRESAADGVDIVKLYLSGLNGTLAKSDWELMLSDEAVAAAAEEASALGLTLSCHVRPVAGLKQALRAGFRMIYHAEEVDDDAIDLMEARKDEMFVGPTISGIAFRAAEGNPPIERERAEERLTRYRDTVSRLRSRGIRVLPFGDYGFPERPHGQNARDLWYFVRYLDFRPAEVLTAATKAGGELMGGKPVGMIAPGYLADLLLVRGDPTLDVQILEDPAKLLMIMQGGRLHKLAASSLGDPARRYWDQALGWEGTTASVAARPPLSGNEAASAAPVRSLIMRA